jgi:hypothetical protein
LAGAAFTYLPREQLVAVQRAPQFFFAISLAVVKYILSYHDAYLPQFTQKVGTPTASKQAQEYFIREDLAP